MIREIQPHLYKKLNKFDYFKLSNYYLLFVKILDEVVTENTFIEAAIDKTEVRAEPYSLPDLFYWSDVDILNIDELTELYNLLAENYVEDDDNMFRFDYKPEFLEWLFYK